MDINKIINIVRTLKEEAPTMSVGTGGLTSSSTPPGRLDGYDKVLSFTRRRPTIIGKGKFPGARTRWRKGLT